MNTFLIALKTIIKILAIIGLLLLFFQKINKYYDGLAWENVAPRAVISDDPLNIVSMIPKQGGEAQSAIDDDIESWWYGQISSDKPVWLKLKWSESKDIDKIILVFGEARKAIDYSIVFSLDNKGVENLKISDNQKNQISHSLEHRIKADEILVNFTKTENPDNIQSIDEIYVLRKKSFMEFIGSVAKSFGAEIKLSFRHGGLLFVIITTIALYLIIFVFKNLKKENQ